MRGLSKYSSIVSFIFFLTILVGCNSASEEKITEAIAESQDEIILSEDQLVAGSIVFGQLMQHEFNTVISVNGRVELVPNNVASVSSLFSGNVVDISVLPGQKVSKGEKLFELENASFIKVQEEYLLTEIECENFQIDYDRQKSLAGDNITSLKSLQTAEKELLKAKIKLSALKSELAMMNINAEKLNASDLTSRISIYSPIVGIVNDISVALGTYVSPEVSAVRIVGQDGEYIVFQIFEKNLEILADISRVEFQIGNQGKVCKAEVLNIIPVVDGNTKSVKVYAKPANDSLILIPGMYVNGKLETSPVLKWALPSDAVVKEGNEYYVWYRSLNDQNTFTKMYVETGVSYNGMTEILNKEDFPKELEIVIKGAFNL